MFGFFANEKSTEREYTRYLIVDDKTLNNRATPGSRARQQVTPTATSPGCSRG